MARYYALTVTKADFLKIFYDGVSERIKTGRTFRKSDDYNKHLMHYNGSIFIGKLSDNSVGVLPMVVMDMGRGTITGIGNIGSPHQAPINTGNSTDSSTVKANSNQSVSTTGEVGNDTDDSKRGSTGDIDSADGITDSVVGGNIASGVAVNSTSTGVNTDVFSADDISTVEFPTSLEGILAFNANGTVYNYSILGCKDFYSGGTSIEELSNRYNDSDYNQSATNYNNSISPNNDSQQSYKNEEHGNNNSQTIYNNVEQDYNGTATKNNETGIEDSTNPTFYKNEGGEVTANATIYNNSDSANNGTTTNYKNDDGVITVGMTGDKNEDSAYNGTSSSYNSCVPANNADVTNYNKNEQVYNESRDSYNESQHIDNGNATNYNNIQHIENGSTSNYSGSSPIQSDKGSNEQSSSAEVAGQGVVQGTDCSTFTDDSPLVNSTADNDNMSCGNMQSVAVSDGVVDNNVEGVSPTSDTGNSGIASELAYIFTVADGVLSRLTELTDSEPDCIAYAVGNNIAVYTYNKVVVDALFGDGLLAECSLSDIASLGDTDISAIADSLSELAGSDISGEEELLEDEVEVVEDEVEVVEVDSGLKDVVSNISGSVTGSNSTITSSVTESLASTDSNEAIPPIVAPTVSNVDTIGGIVKADSAISGTSTAQEFIASHENNTAQDVKNDKHNGIIYQSGMPLLEFLRKNPTIRRISDITEYYSNEDIKSLSKKGTLIISKKRGMVIL